MRRNTLQKQIIIDAIKSLENHPTAEQVYACVIAAHPSISKATVYRNLATAAECGEISSIGVFGGAMHYDHDTREHHHFICDRCGDVIDIVSFDVDKNIDSIVDLKIEKVELTLRGLCKDCM